MRLETLIQPGYSEEGYTFWNLSQNTFFVCFGLKCQQVFLKGLFLSPKLSRWREAFIVAPSIFDSCCPHGSCSWFTWQQYPLKLRLMSGLQDTTWVVLCHLIVPQKSQVVAVDSNQHCQECSECRAPTLTTQPLLPKHKSFFTYTVRGNKCDIKI